jgi:UDP-N-acetylglucosamine:LPS N-acetylglucosamine transferase
MPMYATHQEANARYFADRQASVYLDESEATPESFADLVLSLLANAMRRAELSAKIKTINPPDAAAKIAAAVLALTR